MFIDGLFIAFVLLSMVFILLTAMLATGPQTPVVRVVQIRSDTTMADVLTYRVSAPAPVDADVVARLLSVSVNGNDRGTESYDGKTTDFGTVDVPQDAEIIVSLVDVDDAGNRSEPAVLSFVAVDTVPPAQPGALGVTLEGEKSVES